ncbi:hypothetical protein ACS0TY_002074 [Phlomoides rotata]
MAPSKIRRAIGAIKDRTSISLARVGSSTSISNLEVAVVKATRHNENPPNQRYVTEILSLTSYSRALVNACVSVIGQRLNKTKNWVVALKTLILIQRLLYQGSQVLEKEIFYATRKGTKFLNMCDFRVSSSKSNAWDYTAFIRTYALYLDEQLEFRMQGNRGRSGGFTYRGEEGNASNAMVANGNNVSEMKDDAVFSRINHLVQVLDRFLACRPTGAAKHNRVVIVALFPIVKESIQLFHNITEVLGVLIDRFMQLDIPGMVKVHDIFSRVSKQFDELDSFYDWSKTIGIMCFSDYPEVKKIPQSKLDMMDDFIRQKSAMLQNRKPTPVEQVKKEEPQKALPPPEVATNGEIKETREEDMRIQEVGYLLNLSEDAPGTEEHGDTLALALFNSGPTSTSTQWDSGDWEMALVQSVSQFSNQKPSLPKGLDSFILDDMYQQGGMPPQVVSSSGSASSVAVGFGRGQQMLALPAPPAANGGFSTNYDPFAASLAIAPPPYVQMSEIEKRHQLLVEEQLMWQQYARDGMQGHVGLAKAQQQNSYQYFTGGYTQTW